MLAELSTKSDVKYMNEESIAICEHGWVNNELLLWQHAREKSRLLINVCSHNLVEVVKNRKASSSGGSAQTLFKV